VSFVPSKSCRKKVSQKAELKSAKFPDISTRAARRPLGSRFFHGNFYKVVAKKGLAGYRF
jgi:hypothetical protein